MAEEKDDEAPKEVAPPKAGKGKLFIIIGVVVVLLVVIGGGVFFFMSKNSADKQELGADAAKEAEEGLQPEGSTDEDELVEGEEALGAFFPLETFIVNLDGGKFIRCQIQVEFTERDIPKRFYNRMVPIRDGIITLLTTKKQDDVLSEKGKEELRKELKDLMNETLKKEEVKRIYFTQFVVQ